MGEVARIATATVSAPILQLNIVYLVIILVIEVSDRSQAQIFVPECGNFLLRLSLDDFSSFFRRREYFRVIWIVPVPSSRIVMVDLRVIL